MSTAAPSSSVILRDELFLGNLAAAQLPEHRRRLGITHIVSVCPEYPSADADVHAHLHVPVEDTEYEDLLIHLPKACRFIQDALGDGGRVLVHCVMGVSRSATVTAAFLMKNRKMDARSAIRYVKQRRPQVHPNYGFIKQLDIYAKCQFEPSPKNAVYRSWKKRQEQDVTCFLNQLVDTVSIIPDKMLLSSDFPEDTRQGESLLADLGITHVLSISPAEIPPSALSATLKSKSHYRHINIRNNAKEDLLLALPGAVEFLEEAMSEKDGLVLVHSQMEVRACTVACACLMKQRDLAPDEAYSAIENALPLFNPSVNFSRNLELYDACGYQPTRDHPVVQEWLSSDRPESRLVGSHVGGISDIGSLERPPSDAINPKQQFQLSQPPEGFSGQLQLGNSPTKRVNRSTPTGFALPHSAATSVPLTKIAPSHDSSSLHLTSGSSSGSAAVSSTAAVHLEAKAKDILSGTGLDLTAFGNALKEIESRSACGGSRFLGQSSGQTAAMWRSKCTEIS